MRRGKLPPLNSLRAFDAAGRLESFRLAAEELGVTDGAISRHINQLEEWLGFNLFVRHHRSVELTEDGTTYLPDTVEALDRLSLATSRLLKRREHTVIRVNAGVREIVVEGGRANLGRRRIAPGRRCPVRVSLDPVSTEEMSRIWTLFPTANYRTSVAYVASPVWIDPDQPPAGAAQASPRCRRPCRRRSIPESANPTCWPDRPAASIWKARSARSKRRRSSCAQMDRDRKSTRLNSSHT